MVQCLLSGAESSSDVFFFETSRSAQFQISFPSLKTHSHNGHISEIDQEFWRYNSPLLRGLHAPRFSQCLQMQERQREKGFLPGRDCCCNRDSKPQLSRNNFAKRRHLHRPQDCLGLSAASKVLLVKCHCLQGGTQDGRGQVHPSWQVWDRDSVQRVQTMAVSSSAFTALHRLSWMREAII